MKPEILQTLSQIAILIGIILTGLGGYGHYRSEKLIDKNRETTTNSKLDNIPQSINKNTDRVLDAIDRVELNIQKIIETDGSKILTINYPEIGVFGTNILDKKIHNFNVGTHSMRVEIPKGQSIIVKISGENWAFPALQSIPGWQHYDYETEGNKTIRKFKTVKDGILDLEIYLTSRDEIELLIFENGSNIPNWKKTLIVE